VIRRCARPAVPAPALGTSSTGTAGHHPRVPTAHTPGHLSRASKGTPRRRCGPPPRRVHAHPRALPRPLSSPQQRRDHVRDDQGMLARRWRRLQTAQVNEVLAMCAAHNLCCLVKAIVSAGLVPAFWQGRADCAAFAASRGALIDANYSCLQSNRRRSRTRERSRACGLKQLPVEPSRDALVVVGHGGSVQPSVRDRAAARRARTWRGHRCWSPSIPASPTGGPR
jgi:hypothetical protein